MLILQRIHYEERGTKVTQGLSIQKELEKDSLLYSNTRTSRHFSIPDFSLWRTHLGVRSMSAILPSNLLSWTLDFCPLPKAVPVPRFRDMGQEEGKYKWIKMGWRRRNYSSYTMCSVLYWQNLKTKQAGGQINCPWVVQHTCNPAVALIKSSRTFITIIII